MTKEKIKELFDKQYKTLGKSVKDKLFLKSSALNTIYHAPLDNNDFIAGTIFNTSNIRYGCFLEEVINSFLEENGAKIYSEKKQGNYDLLFERNGVLYVGEIKIRDNHDSTKKKGQIENLERKATEQKKKHWNQRVVALLYFVDPFEKKNSNYYLNKLNDCVSEGAFDEGKLFYGDEIFKELDLYKEWEQIKKLIQEQNNYFKKMGYLKKIIIEYIDTIKNENLKLNMKEMFKKEE